MVPGTLGLPDRSSNENIYCVIWVKFSGNEKTQNLVDAGANFLLGYKLANGFLINAEYGLGITDLNPDEKNNHFHNRTIRFGVGFQF
jgi:hypothetical protein